MRLRIMVGAFAAFLMVQAAVAATIVEPYPAFLYPPFARVKGETGTIDVLKPQFDILFSDGSSAEATLEQVFAGVPRNLAFVMAKEALLPAADREEAILKQTKAGFRQALIRWRATIRARRQTINPHGMDEHLRSWLHSNLERQFSRKPTRLTLKWWSLIYSDELEPVTLTKDLLAEFSCEF